jgi:hypothetical protein
VKQLAVMLVAFALTACAGHDLSPERASRIKTIGIVSIMGPIHHEYVAGIFDRRSEEIPSDDWELDSFVVDRVTEQLKARYDVRTVTYDKSKLTVPAPWFLGARTGGAILTPPDVGSVQPQGLDAYVVVVPGAISAPGGSLTLMGLGFIRLMNIFGEDSYGVRAPYVIYVMDAKTGSKIAFEGRDDGVVWRAVDKSWWADPVGAMSEQQRLQLRDAVDDMIARTLPETLQRIKLVP